MTSSFVLLSSLRSERYSSNRFGPNFSTRSNYYVYLNDQSLGCKSTLNNLIALRQRLSDRLLYVVVLTVESTYLYSGCFVSATSQTQPRYQFIPFFCRASHIVVMMHVDFYIAEQATYAVAPEVIPARGVCRKCFNAVVHSLSPISLGLHQLMSGSSAPPQNGIFHCGMHLFRVGLICCYLSIKGCLFILVCS